MAVQILGTIFNTYVAGTHLFWGLKWGCIDQSLQVFVIGNVKIIYGILTVLMGVPLPVV